MKKPSISLEVGGFSRMRKGFLTGALQNDARYLGGDAYTA